MSETVPIVDAAGVGVGVAATRRVAAALGEACRGTGFFLVVNHGIAPGLRDELFATARAFFALPHAAKDAASIRHSPHNRGYVGLSEEQLDPTRPADNKEAFNVGLEIAPDDPELGAGVPFRGMNLWPDSPEFREATLAWFAACHELGMRLHRAFAMDLGQDEGFFEDKLDRPIATLRLLRYPCGGDPGVLGAGEHTDYGNLTILATDGAPGLEVRRRDGAWLEVPDVKGALVCNIGDCLMRWSNGTYVSTPHRVRSPARERYSAAFFLDANPGAVVEALPGTTGPGRPALWPPITSAAYLRERLDATYAHRGAEPAKG